METTTTTTSRRILVLAALLAVGAVACGQGALTLPYSTGFEGGLGLWTAIDSNADGHTWNTSPWGTAYIDAHGGSTFAGSSSYLPPVAGGIGAIAPDDWLVSPAISLTDTAVLRWWHRAGQRLYYAEHYTVYISTTGATAADFKTADSLFGTTLTAADTVWQQRSVNLAAYVGDTVWIAFRHHGCSDQWALLIDDVSIGDSLYPGYDYTPLPYHTGFEPADDTGWFLGGNRNHWYIDTAAHSTGQRALYISCDSGATNCYDGNVGVNAWAVRDIALQGGQYTLSYDWRAGGYVFPYLNPNPAVDYLRVFLMPGTTRPDTALTNGRTMPDGFYNTVPVGWIDLSGNDSILYLCGSPTGWQHVSCDFTVPEGRYRLAFIWINSINAMSTQPPAAVDNVSLAIYSSCVSVGDLQVEAGADSLVASWTPQGTEALWAVTLGDSLYAIVDTPRCTLPSMAEALGTTVGVQAVCGTGDTSFAVDLTITAGTVNCGLHTLPYSEDFEAYDSLEHDIPCWDCHYYAAITDSTGTHRMPYVVGGDTDPQGYLSDRAYWFYASTSTMRGICTPWFDAPSDSLTLTFRLRPLMVPDSISKLNISVLTKADERAGMEWSSDLMTVDGASLDSGWYLCSVTTRSLPAGDTVCFCLRHEGYDPGYYNRRFTFSIDDVEVRRLANTDTDGVWSTDTTHIPDTTQVPDTVGIAAAGNDAMRVAIQPNPSHGDVTISVGTPSTLTIVDMAGRIVLPPTQVKSAFTIRRSALHPGAYFVSVTNAAGSTVRKLTIVP